MKRKFLAALLALVMVFSMIPVSASAAGSFTGDDIDNAKAIEYQSSDVDMLKLLHINNENVTKDTEIKGVSITFNNGDTQNFLTPTSIDDHVGSFDKTPYFYYTFENVTENNVPSKVTSIAVTYDNGSGETTLTVPADNLLFSNEEKPGRNICAIKSADTSVSVVAFYYEADSNVTLWDLYDIRFVTTGESFEKNNALPAAPVYNENIGNEYKFVNWDYSVNGGNPFLTYTPITGDTVLYAQKVSSEAAGSEYHVMNENNALLGRFIELYNAEYGTTLTINDVEKKSLKISVSGDGVSTDEDCPANRWDTWDGREYYYVYNVGANLIQYHVPFNKAESLTIYAEVNDKEESYTVSINCEEPGAFSITLVQDNIAELIVNPAPQVPSTDDLEKEEDNTILPDGAVTIHCTNEQADHVDKTYSLIAGTYTVSKSATWVSDGEGSGYYTAEVTIDFDKVDQYVTKYATEYVDVTHTLVPEQGDQKITLIWQNGQWVADESAPVTYNVVCDTEPEDEPPENPTWEDVERIFKDAIKVDCVNSNATHNDGTYDALEGSYTLGTITPSENLYTVELTFSAEKYLSEYNNLYGNHVLTGEQKNVLTLIYRNDIWCYEGGERYPVIFSVTCEDGGEEPDSNFVTQYWVMNNLDVIEKVFSAKEPDKELAGIELGTSTGIATDGETLGNGWNNSEDKHYYIVSNGEPNGDNYVPWKEVSRLTFLYENGSNGITNLDIRVEEPDENGISKVYLLYDVRYNFNNGTTNGWNHTDSTKNWASASTYTVVTPTSPYLTPPNGDGREVELIGWSQTQHNTIFEPNAELPDHLTAGGTFTVDPNAENTNNTSLMINLYAVWAYKDTSTEPTPEPTPDPDPTPDPTPTPGPGGGDKPPYIPPVDPDDSGVSDLLNTDDHIQYLFGYPEGTFGPENNMTRAEVAQMFYNLLLDQDVTITKTFDDVPANAWYAKAVNTLASLGVVSGVGNGDFEPERSITRAEFTSIAMKFAEGKTGGTNIFSDVKSTDWFYRAVVNSTQYGWIHGYGDGTFRPNNPITRVEVTAIVNNMLGREADVDFVTEHYDELNHFSDLVVSHWGYYHIVEATNDHDYTKPSSGENWTELN